MSGRPTTDSSGPMRAVSLTLSPRHIEILDAEARRTEGSRSQVIRRLLDGCASAHVASIPTIAATPSLHDETDETDETVCDHQWAWDDRIGENRCINCQELA